MREQFSCFYNDESESYLKPIWESDKTLFVFDTNVLIDLYAFQPESREDFFKVLDKLRDKIWLPYHVGLEYQRRRLEIIKIRREHFKRINREIDELQHSLSFDQKKFTTLTTQLITKKAYPKLYENINILADTYVKEIDKVKQKLKIDLDMLKEEVKEYDKDKIFLSTEDHIRKKIDEYFVVDKLGKCLFSTQEEVEDFNLKGEERFSMKTPPGYEDEQEKGDSIFTFNGLTYKRKFGDLIIFNEMIEIAKLKKCQNIIFISGDRKSDWRIIEQLEGSKVLGARTELKMEMKNKAEVENFYIFQVEEFLNQTKKFLDVHISDESLTDIKKSLSENKLKIKIEKREIDKIKNSSALYKLVYGDKVIDFDANDKDSILEKFLALSKRNDENETSDKLKNKNELYKRKFKESSVDKWGGDGQSSYEKKELKSKLENLIQMRVSLENSIHKLYLDESVLQKESPESKVIRTQLHEQLMVVEQQISYLQKQLWDSNFED